MTYQAELKLLTLSSIAHRCARETNLFFQRLSYDPWYCFELFRRAIVDRSQSAWEHVYRQYRALVTGWVERHAAFPASGEETDYFVNRAFEKMWVALTPDRFDRFPDLRSLLRYLQLCTHSAILDLVRAAEQATLGIEEETDAVASQAKGVGVDDQAMARVYRQELWREINARLHDEKEQRVVYGSFVLALKPREIYTHFSGTFRDIDEVYRVKENVLARLRRDPELKKFMVYDA